MKFSPKALLATMSLPLLLAGCSTVDNTKQPITAADLQHHWELVNINGEPFNPAARQKRPFLDIGEAMKTNGNAGCNNFIGQGEFNDGQFRVDRMGMTMKMCIGDIMDFEQSIAQTLQNWSSVTQQGDTLILTSDVNQLTYQLSDPK